MGKLRQSTAKIQEILDQADGIREALEKKADPADWNASEGDGGYIANKPFGELYNKLEWYYYDNADGVLCDTAVDKVFIDGKEYDLTLGEILNIDNTNFGIGIDEYYNKVKIYGAREDDVDWVTDNVLAGDVKQLDEQFIPENIARKSDIVAPDWNINEGELGYIKNRTHYKKYSPLEDDSIVSMDDVFIIINLDYIGSVALVENLLWSDNLVFYSNNNGQWEFDWDTEIFFTAKVNDNLLTIYSDTDLNWAEWLNTRIMQVDVLCISEDYIPTSIRSGAAKGATAIQSVKTINGQSLVGSGDITIKGGEADWNAKDGEDGYIKNKPFYDKIDQKFDADKFSYDEDREEFYLDLYSLSGDDIYIKYREDNDSNYYKVQSFQLEYGYYFHFFIDDDSGVSCYIKENEDGHAVLVADMLRRDERDLLQALLNEYLSYCLRWQWDDDEVIRVIQEFYIPYEIARTDDLKKKQDKISDLAAIRSGASKGATAIQSVKTINGQSLVGSGDIIIKSDIGVYGDGYIESEVAEEGTYLTTNVAENLDEVSARGQLADAYDVKTFVENAVQGGGGIMPITYAELVELRNKKDLSAGTLYRITDFVTTTVQENTKSAGNPFDIVVLAIGSNEISEEAYALHSDRDTDGYFAKSNLSAWKVWYCLDNDTTRFAWADNENGKGVIYRMIDEWENDIPYDFKNIQFIRTINLDYGYPRFMEDGIEKWVYTFCGNSYHVDNGEFSELKDGSLEPYHNHESDEGYSTFHHNTVKPRILIYDDEDEDYHKCGRAYLNNNVFLGYWEEIGSTTDESVPYFYASCCYSNALGFDCYNNTFGCNCNSNILGEKCHSNILGPTCLNNTFKNNCRENTFDDSCCDNTIGNNNQQLSLGVSCHTNVFLDNCGGISLKELGCYNTFGEGSWGINCGSNCQNNTFGKRCVDIEFVDQNDYANNIWNNKFDDGLQSVQFYIDEEHNKYPDAYYKNYHICKGVQDESIELLPNNEYETTVAMKSDGTIVEFVLADLKAS